MFCCHISDLSYMYRSLILVDNMLETVSKASHKTHQWYIENESSILKNIFNSITKWVEIVFILFYMNKFHEKGLRGWCQKKLKLYLRFYQIKMIKCMQLLLLLYVHLQESRIEDRILSSLSRNSTWLEICLKHCTRVLRTFWNAYK